MKIYKRRVKFRRKRIKKTYSVKSICLIICAALLLSLSVRTGFALDNKGFSGKFLVSCILPDDTAYLMSKVIFKNNEGISADNTDYPFYYLNKKTDADKFPIIPAFYEAKNTSSYLNGSLVYVKNHTTLKPDILSLLKASNQKVKDDGPQVLIVCTHSTESYTAEGVTAYDGKTGNRTTDKERNVIKVAEEFAKVLTDNGINVIQDKTINDYPNYTGSYSRMETIIKDHLEKNPTIKFVIDIHRDSITDANKAKYKAVSKQGDKQAAQVMIVSGTPEGGLEFPTWQENLKLAVNWQEAILKKNAGLCRPLCLAKARYNEHLTEGSLILEVGTDGNTLAEAIYAAQLSATALVNVIKN